MHNARQMGRRGAAAAAGRARAIGREVLLCYRVWEGSRRELACDIANASFSHHRQAVLEPARRLGITPAHHGTPSPVRQALRAGAEAQGGRYRFLFFSRQLGALELEVPIAPERARHVQHQMGWAHGEGGPPRDQAAARRRQWEDWVEKCTLERLRTPFERAAIVPQVVSDRFEG